VRHRVTAAPRYVREKLPLRCLRCGFLSVEEQRCKRICANCGYQECCADACLPEETESEAVKGALPSAALTAPFTTPTLSVTA
jgi:hypothetical protein